MAKDFSIETWKDKKTLQGKSLSVATNDENSDIAIAVTARDGSKIAATILDIEVAKAVYALLGESIAKWN